MTDRLVIRHARIWPHPGAEVMEAADVEVRDGRIYHLGKVHAPSGRVIDAHGALCMPGFVQSHVHLCQTLFRGVAEDLPLLPWLREYIWPMEAAHTPESLRTSAELACAELLRGGTVGVLTMETTRHTEAVAEVVHRAGLHARLGHCLMDESSGFPPIAEPLDQALAHLDAWQSRWADHPRVGWAVAPRFALACTAAHMQEAAAYAADRGLMVHTHASEHLEEVRLVRERTGMDNIAFLRSVGICGPTAALAHCIHLSAEERSMIRDDGTRVLHCPSANLKLGSGIAPVPEYLAHGVSVSLGADGAPCNNTLDAFMEMRLAALLQKPRRGTHALAARDVVRLATTGGAAAAGWGHELGRLEPGRRASFILLDLEKSHVWPTEDVATAVVYSARASDVVLTVIDGIIRYQQGAGTFLDEAALGQRARRERCKLEQRAGLRS